MLEIFNLRIYRSLNDRPLCFQHELYLKAPASDRFARPFPSSSLVRIVWMTNNQPHPADVWLHSCLSGNWVHQYFPGRRGVWARHAASMAARRQQPLSAKAPEVFDLTHLDQVLFAFTAYVFPDLSGDISITSWRLCLTHMTSCASRKAGDSVHDQLSDFHTGNLSPITYGWCSLTQCAAWRHVGMQPSSMTTAFIIEVE